MGFIGKTTAATPLTEQANETPAPSFLVLRILLVLLALAAGWHGFEIMGSAKSAMHEIEAYLCFLTGAVFFSAAAVMEGLRAVSKRIRG